MWQVQHDLSGRKLILYERPTRREAEELLERMEKNDRLVTDLLATTSDAEKEQIEALRLANIKKLVSEGYGIFERCMHIPRKEADKIPHREAYGILVKVLKFALEG